MKNFKIKFFGSKNQEQIKQVKLIIESPDRKSVEDILRYKYQYKVINGLKINDYDESR